MMKTKIMIKTMTMMKMKMRNPKQRRENLPSLPNVLPFLCLLEQHLTHVSVLNKTATIRRLRIFRRRWSLVKLPASRGAATGRAAACALRKSSSTSSAELRAKQLATSNPAASTSGTASLPNNARQLNSNRRHAHQPAMKMSRKIHHRRRPPRVRSSAAAAAFPCSQRAP